MKAAAQFNPPPKRRPTKEESSCLPWLKVKPWQWEATLRGSPIIYWPDQRRWEWRGESIEGNIAAFVWAMQSRAPEAIGDAFALMDAAQQARAINSFVKAAAKWDGKDSAPHQFREIFKLIEPEQKAHLKRWFFSQ